MTHPEPLRCSFCGKSQHDVTLLIADALANICGECVDLATAVARHSRTGIAAHREMLPADIGLKWVVA